MINNVLITSPKGYATRLKNAFEKIHKNNKLNIISLPIIETYVDVDNNEFKEFVNKLDDLEYIAFSSRKAIEAFDKGIKLNKISLPSNIKLCAIGKDNELLEQLLERKPEFISAEPSPMGIVKHLKEHKRKEKKIAVITPKVLGMEEPSIVPDFIKELKNIGMEVTRINAYQTKAAQENVLQEIYSEIEKEKINTVIFTSGTEIKVFKQIVEKQKNIKKIVDNLNIICFGPYTAKCAKEYGIKVDFVSKSFGSFEELVMQIEKKYK